MNHLKEKIDMESVTTISKYYQLDSKAVSRILQAFKNITPEQCKMAAVILAKFATKEV
ncbi:MAG: hypothetical protein K2H93_03140 [Oscillospiraceae bacterium]|nr:hypothetical protein [Oscillospiraceae bacterium]